MKRVLFLLRSFNIGGAERQLILLASALQERGYSVKIAIFYTGAPLEIEAKKMNIEVIDLKRRNRLHVFSFFFRLVHLVQQEKPDVFHSYLPVANIWAVFVKIFLPTTKVVWGVRASNVDLRQYNWQTRLTDYVESLLSKIPDWIICNSHAGLLHAVEKGFPKERMSVIPNGIDTNRFFPDRERGRRLRKHWNIYDHQKLIGMVARMDPMKGYPNFLRASSLLIKDRDDIRFVCIGDGQEDLTKEYRELAFSLGLDNMLTWAGNRDDMLDVYNALDIFVSASVYGEGFSNVIGEAMACGIPCVVTDVGDLAWLVGDLGVVVSPDNSEALKDGIVNLLKLSSQEGTSFTDQLTQRVAQKFSVDALVSNTISLFDKII